MEDLNPQHWTDEHLAFASEHCKEVSLKLKIEEEKLRRFRLQTEHAACPQYYYVKERYSSF